MDILVIVTVYALKDMEKITLTSVFYPGDKQVRILNTVPRVINNVLDL